MAETEQTLEQLAQEKLSMAFMVRREMKKLPELLAESEDAVNLARGEYDGKEGLIVVTDRRVMFVEQGMIRHNFEDFPYDKVVSVKTESGLRSGKITIHSGGNKAELKDIHPKARVNEIGDYVRARIAAESTPAPATGGADTGTIESPTEQLKKLAELRDAGIVTPEEFEAKKAELLARM
jgi:PH (Pleckstrin Homology) domain-containing protein/putative oligomerization/nucleic acid binding protein